MCTHNFLPPLDLKQYKFLDSDQRIFGFLLFLFHEYDEFWTNHSIFHLFVLTILNGDNQHILQGFC